MRWNRARVITSFCCTIIAFLLAIFVLVGWATCTPVLIQGPPMFVPMQFNTALCFLLITAALLLSFARGMRVIVWCLCSLVFLLACLTLLEYVLQMSFGIDELLFNHYITTKSHYPGRMAPNTALCFIFSAVAVGFLLSRTKKMIRFSVPSLLSAIVFAVALIALIGYALSFRAAYTWRHLTSMAVYSALCFGFLGVGIYCRALPERWSVRASSWLFYPMGLGAIYILLTFVGLLESFSLSRDPNMLWILSLLFAFLLVAIISVWIFHNVIESVYFIDSMRDVANAKREETDQLATFLRDEVAYPLSMLGDMEPQESLAITALVQAAVSDMARFILHKEENIGLSLQLFQFDRWFIPLRLFFDQIAQEREVHLEYHIAPPSGEIRCDTQKLGYILSSLMRYCIQQTMHKESVRMEVHTKEKSLIVRASYSSVSGAKKAQKLIAPYEETVNLLLTYVTAVRGSIWFDIEKGKRVTFTFKLPI